MRPRLSLATQILALQVLIVLVTVAVSALVGVQQMRSQLTRQEGAKALAVAEAVASLPTVRAAFDDADPRGSCSRSPSRCGARAASPSSCSPTATRCVWPTPTSPRSAGGCRPTPPTRSPGSTSSPPSGAPSGAASGRRCRCSTRPGRSSASSRSGAWRPGSGQQWRGALPAAAAPAPARARGRGVRLVAARPPPQAADVRPRAGRDRPAARAARGHPARRPRGAARPRRPRVHHARQRRGGAPARTSRPTAPAEGGRPRPHALGCATSSPARPTARTRSCCGPAASWCSTGCRSTSAAGASAPS